MEVLPGQGGAEEPEPLLTSGMRVPVTHSQSFPSPIRAGSLYQDSW